MDYTVPTSKKNTAEFLNQIPKYKELEGKVVLVTGGTGDLGKEICLFFAAQNSHVIVSSKNNSENNTGNLLQILAEISPKANHTYISADITDEKDIKNMFDTIYEKFGTLDVLVNSVGILGSNLIVEESQDQSKHVFAINYFGPRNTCREFIFRKTEEYKERSIDDKTNVYSRIIILSSIMSKVGNVGQSSYSASKAALNILTQSLSDEIQKKYKLHNFTINAISPGIIDTKMAHEVPERVRDMCLKQIPMNRFGKAEEIAQTALFIASKGAGYITGKIFEVDGGWYNG